MKEGGGGVKTAIANEMEAIFRKTELWLVKRLFVCMTLALPSIPCAFTT